MSDERKKALDADRIEYGKDTSAFKELFEKANSSDYLQGRSGSGWVADFDWITAPNHVAKILEGKYDNWHEPPVTKKGGGSFDTDDFFNLAVTRSLQEGVPTAELKSAETFDAESTKNTESGELDVDEMFNAAVTRTLKRLEESVALDESTVVLKKEFAMKIVLDEGA